MKFYSLGNTTSHVDFKTATLKGQAEDKGLYFPATIPVLPSHFFQQIESYSKEEIAFTVMKSYLEKVLPPKVLQNILDETINFKFPLVPVTGNIFSLELFHGPTMAFKDVGARFMSRCLRYFAENLTKKITVLVATSGDTGGAVAHGFYEVEGVDVVILYPSGKVSSVQELQLTTLGKNIFALEVDGNFDDCQQLVKQAFSDKDLNEKLILTSANSINVARWLPQQLYYFFAYQQWNDKTNPPVFSVPSGNFGNIAAGLLAYKSGLPVSKFIAACNENDVVPRFLKTGNYEPKKAIATLSNAMDVGDPSNFIRILELFEKDYEQLKNILVSYVISDVETKEAIKQVYKQYNYLMDPHGAVGFAALEKYIQQHSQQKGIFLETAHHLKFYELIEKIIEKNIHSDQIEKLLKKNKSSVLMKADYQIIKEFLLSK